MKINEKNLCVFATTPPYDLEGFLNKRGEVNKAWQKRYFVLKGNLLFYFERKGDKEPLGLIIVEGCTIELAEEGEPYSFQIVFNGNRTYTLSAENQNVMELWMKALTCAGYEYKKLMVAELQRQLEEIEESEKKQMEELIKPLAPKPPPRRQNPFNRPAPPPPINLLTKTNEEPSTSLATSAVPTATDVMENLNSNEIFNNTILNQSLTNLTHFGDDQQHQRQQQQPHQHQQQQHQQQQPQQRKFSFRTVHEKFTKEILNDINERRKAIQDNEQPLIIL